MQNGTNVPASVGGLKLIGAHLQNDTVFKTIVFPPNVAFADSVSSAIPAAHFAVTKQNDEYINDMRFDLQPHLTASGQGIAYKTDSSPKGRNGLITIDLGTGESWRHPDNHSLCAS